MKLKRCALRDLIRDDTGSALVIALLFIAALALSATIIVWISISDKGGAFNQFSHFRAFNAADAGSEQAINWLRSQAIPPAVVTIDPQTNEHLVLDDAAITLEDNEDFHMDIEQELNALGMPAGRPRPGWDPSWVDYGYVINSYGNSINESNSRVEVHASRLFRVDY